MSTMIFMIVLVSYLLGSLPFGYIAGRARGIDITSRGSGNIGATNTLRTLGVIPAILVLLGDIGKGVLAVWLGSSLPPPEGPLLAAVSVLAGHGWSVFLRFKGGKMIATSVGVLIMLAPNALLAAAAVWFATVVTCRYVSLASILAAVSIPLSMTVFHYPLTYVLFAVALAVTVTFKHRANITRLLSGTESKFSLHKGT